MCCIQRYWLQRCWSCWLHSASWRCRSSIISRSCWSEREDWLSPNRAASGLALATVSTPDAAAKAAAAAAWRSCSSWSWSCAENICDCCCCEPGPNPNEEAAWLLRDANSKRVESNPAGRADNWVGDRPKAWPNATALGSGKPIPCEPSRFDMDEFKEGEKPDALACACEDCCKRIADAKSLRPPCSKADGRTPSGVGSRRLDIVPGLELIPYNAR